MTNPNWILVPLEFFERSICYEKGAWVVLIDFGEVEGVLLCVCKVVDKFL